MLCFSTVDLSDYDDDDDDNGDETSSVVATCVQTMPQLRTLVILSINPLPVLQSLSHRDSPLDSVRVEGALWVCRVYTYSHATSVLVTYLFATHTWRRSTVITVLCVHVCVKYCSLRIFRGIP